MSKLKHKEDETYRLEPGPDHEQNWHIRILEGMYVESVVEIGAIAINDEAEGTMSFDFTLISSPNTELNETDVGLQLEVGEILQEVIRSSIEAADGSIEFKEREKE